MGLSIGVHLLNLLAIPALVFMFYYRRNEQGRFGFWELVKIMLIGVVILGIVDALGDVAALLVHTVEDAARVGIKLVLTLGVADFLDHLTRCALQVDVNVGGHLAGNNHLPRRHQRLACHMGM